MSKPYRAAKVLFFITGILISLMISSCGKSSVTKTPTSVLPTITHRLVPTVDSIPTPTLSVFQTPTITSTPIQNPSQYELPDWMKNPENTILMDAKRIKIKGNLFYSLSFLNVSTGEWYELPPLKKMHYYFWLDNMHAGYLSDDLQEMYLLDFTTGKVVNQSISSQSVKSLNPDFFQRSLQVSWDSSSNENKFNYAGTRGGSDLSKDGRYRTILDSKQADRHLSVQNVETGETVWQSAVGETHILGKFSWSPTEDNYLAVVEGIKGPSYDFDLTIKNNNLMVIDVSTGKIVTSVKDDVGLIYWSPDGTKILYQNSESINFHSGYQSRQAPCIFSIQTVQSKCIWNIVNRPIPPGYELITTALYEWSEMSDRIYFVYEYFYQGEMKGSLCLYDLYSGDIQCPVDRTEVPSEWVGQLNYGSNIAWYDISPDENFLHFCISSRALSSDDDTGPSTDGAVNINGQGLTTWYGPPIYESDDQLRCSLMNSIWRPLP